MFKSGSLSLKGSCGPLHSALLTFLQKGFAINGGNEMPSWHYNWLLQHREKYSQMPWSSKDERFELTSYESTVFSKEGQFVINDNGCQAK